MAKLVLLKLTGDFESGFQVSLEIGREGKPFHRGISGSLPPGIKLRQCLASWEQQYRQLQNNHRIKPQQIIYDGSIDPQKDLARAANCLQQELQNWLNSPSFNSVDRQLREELHRRETIRIVVCCDRYELFQLPWCCWDLVQNYPHSEVAVSNFDFELVSTPQKPAQNSQVKILAILGNSQGINLEADRLFLNSLSDGEVKFLVEPTRQQLYAHLWKENWDIVFFAGHSKTVAGTGVLCLNQEDELTIEELRYGFQKAIANGLQLAIFNSCDGLGLAKSLSELSLPQAIVMRLPIPDIMAQQFLKYFLQAYAGGSSLYLATRMAREQLQGWEKQFPCASWLPTIYQNPAIIPPNWHSLRGDCLKKTKKSKWGLFSSILLSSAIATILVWIIQSWGWLQAGELKTYDRWMNWRASLPADERLLVITIDDDDINYQREQGLTMNMQGSLADSTLEKLLNKLQPYHPSAIASDIIHDFPFTPELAHTVQKTADFLTICRVKVPQSKLITIAPPPQLSQQQIGFSNWAIDNDGTIRRQVLGMSADDLCQSSLSFSLRLALKYLDNYLDNKLGNVSASFNDQGLLQINGLVFPKLNISSGGYQLPEAQGYQVLLNYRRGLPQTIPLRQIFNTADQSLEKLVKDKIVFIGVLGHNNDLHYTPYSQEQQAQRLPGVVIHSQMTSQIISTVLGEQKLLRWVPDEIELLWIALWSIVGSSIILIRSSLTQIAIAISGALTILFACCWILFLNGCWITAIAPALGLLSAAAIIAVRFWPKS